VTVRTLAAAALAAGVAASAACGTAGVADKTGGTVTELRFATIDTLNPNGEIVAPAAFVDAVGRLSNGRLRVTVADHYGDGDAAAETEMVTAIAAGTLDGGFPASRAFGLAGLHGLDAVDAPFTLTTYAAQRSLVSGPGAGVLLATLDGSGVVGLGLTVGPLRRPWSVSAPLTEARNWRGVSFRTFHNTVQADTVAALGGSPVDASYTFPDLVLQGTLQAVETDVAQYVRNGYGRLLPVLAGDVVLWPRMPVIAMSRQRFDALPAPQQKWLRAAAGEAVRASADHAYDDSAFVEPLCRTGVRVAPAAPGQLAELRRAVAPVLDRLAGDPVTAPSMVEVRKAAAAAAAEPLTVPPECRLPG
jgi:TRAP-type C4-dicarboxylate transport system substrate-binding protein